MKIFSMMQVQNVYRISRCQNTTDFQIKTILYCTAPYSMGDGEGKNSSILKYLYLNAFFAVFARFGFHTRKLKLMQTTLEIFDKTREKHTITSILRLNKTKIIINMLDFRARLFSFSFFCDLFLFGPSRAQETTNNKYQQQQQ